MPVLFTLGAVAEEYLTTLQAQNLVLKGSIMANRSFNQFGQTLEKAVVNLYTKVAVGATGAPTITAANSKGIATVVRNSAGKYTITLQDTYNKLLAVDCAILLASGLPAARDFAVVSQAVTVAAAPTVVIQFATGGAATEVDNGAVLYFNITLSNSSAF